VIAGEVRGVAVALEWTQISPPSGNCMNCESDALS
jgi:hypothetical protein